MVDPLREVGNGYAIVVTSHGAQFTVTLDGDGRPEAQRVTKTWDS